MRVARIGEKQIGAIALHANVVNRHVPRYVGKHVFAVANGKRALDASAERLNLLHGLLFG